MTDREKVIKQIEVDIGRANRTGEMFVYVGRKTATDALALLKAQEPKPPIITENAYGWKFYHCPSCGREFYADRLHGRMNKTKFCDNCGQAVKWDD